MQHSIIKKSLDAAIPMLGLDAGHVVQFKDGLPTMDDGMGFYISQLANLEAKIYEVNGLIRGITDLTTRLRLVSLSAQVPTTCRAYKQARTRQLYRLVTLATRSITRLTSFVKLNS